MAPEADFGPEAKLVLGGTDIPVQVKVVRKAPDLTFEFISHGETIEIERYRWTDQEFSLAEATTEVYEPPMPLLKFPMKVGDEWTWVGQLKNASGSKAAKAAVTTGVAQTMNVGAEAVLTEVKLVIEGGGPKPSEKKMSFYFSPGKGLVKREFGFASTREPMEKAP